MAKIKKINFKSKKTWKNILLIVLACITLVGAIVGLSALFKKAEETTKEISPKYSVGALDVSTGKYVETKSAIYTRDGIECKGLTTSLDFDAVVKYQLYFYSEHDEFIHTTGTLDGVFYSTGVPVYAKYVRIVIIPNEDENINWFEKFDYAKQLNVEVAKEQNFKTFGENLFKVDEELGPDKLLDSKDGVTVIEATSALVTNEISLNSKRHSLLITVMSYPTDNLFGLYLYDKDGSFIRHDKLASSANTIYNVSTGKWYYQYDFGSDVCSFRCFANAGNEPEIYLY